MVILRTYFLTIMVLCLWSCPLESAADVFARVKLNRSQVYPKEAIKATITLYTSTWFTSPLEFDNMQVPNAFVIPFKRTQSGMRNVGKKKYASIEFYYLIYPYVEGEYSFPELEIIAESPKEGDYKGVKVTVRTEAQDFMVKAIPDKLSDDEWLVAKSVRLEDRWSKPLDQLQIGDVIERTITITASGALPNFIPALEWDGLPYASIYPKTAELKDLRNARDVNGKRTEKALYLFEREGSFELPGLEFEWWDPYRQQMFSRKIDAISIVVTENPDMGMVRTVQDSLSQVTARTTAAETEKSISWLLYCQVALALLAVYCMFLLMRRWVMRCQFKREAYRSSEAYLFQLIGKSDGDSHATLTSIYQWWDSFRTPLHLEPALGSYIDSDGFKKDWDRLTGNHEVTPTLLKHLEGLRRRLKRQSGATTIPDRLKAFE